jgi:flagellar basal-body rod protein FlgB
MIDRLTQSLDFHATALLLRSERSRALASNIANADTPHYKARDIDFRQTLERATGVRRDLAGAGAPLRAAMVDGHGAMAAGLPSARTHAAHLQAAGVAPAAPTLLYRTPLQTSLDGNTVDMDMERASFADNTLRYEASLRFINGQIRTLITAINGQ